MRRLLALLLCSLTLFACGESGPKNGKYWADKLVKEPRARQQAVRELRKLKDATAVPGLLEALKQDGNRYKADAARLIGELGDASAVPGLIAGLDLSVITLTGDDAKVRNQVNGRIAQALGKIGDPAGVEPLIKLLGATDGFVQLSAIRALDRMRAAAAVDPLLALVEGAERKESVKAAVIALGNLGDPRALLLLVRMLFDERRGSFFREASFAVFQFGPQAVDPLLAAQAGQDPAIATLGLDPAVVPAKVAQLLGELGDARAVPVLRQMLAFKDEASPLQAGALVRGNALVALARLGDTEILSLVRRGVLEVDPAVRAFSVKAAGLLGDRSVVPALLEAAAHEPFATACKKAGFEEEACSNSEKEARLLAARGLTRLADASSQEAFAKLVAAEKDPAYQAMLQAEAVRLEVAKECAQQVECFAGRLATPVPAGADEVATARAAASRDKAAYELAYLKNPLAAPALLAAVGDPDPEVRIAVGLALERLLPKVGADDVEKVVAKDRGKSTYVQANDYLRRVALKMRRAVQK